MDTGYPLHGTHHAINAHQNADDRQKRNAPCRYTEGELSNGIRQNRE